jgi:hypothetical protein
VYGILTPAVDGVNNKPSELPEKKALQQKYGKIEVISALPYLVCTYALCEYDQ